MLSSTAFFPKSLVEDLPTALASTMVPKSGLALALAFFAVPATAVSINKRITGGEEALEGEFGSIVSIQSSNHFCAGVLLDSTTVLTAAHCASLDSVDQENYLVKAGTVASLPFSHPLNFCTGVQCPLCGQ